MIPKECKRLAEVDFPIAVVSKHAAREKSIRHGHPSTLHLWWARRPLAACRAMLLALLLPDPCDPLCPRDFKMKARDLLPAVQGNPGPADQDLRKALLKFIGDFSNWDLSSNQTYLEISRGLVKVAHPEETPLVVDPFAGGGSIPLEALRLGCETFASDLNPVACLILKVILEDIPRHGPELADELRRVGKEIKEAAERELKEFYPDDPDGSKPIAYLWARTVRCEAPNCGAEIPLVRSFWLCKKANRKQALKYKVVRPKNELPCVEFEVFKPKSEKDVPGGTVSRAKATCVACGTVLSPERVRVQLGEQHGGADVDFDGKGNRIGGALMLAAVTLRPGETGRHYRLPVERDYLAVWKAKKGLKATLDEWERSSKKSLCPVPDELLPRERQKGNSGFRVLLYGNRSFGDLFSARQKFALLKVFDISRNVMKNQDNSILSLTTIGVSKSVELANANCRWEPVAECPRSIFSRQAIQASWDFAEGVLNSGSSGGVFVTLENVASALKAIGSDWNIGQVNLADACEHPLPNESGSMFFVPTDLILPIYHRSEIPPCNFCY